ncbi:MAG: hypothetical protein V1695_00405 [Candidatus Uhrbacteria bacterium]
MGFKEQLAAFREHHALGDEVGRGNKPITADQIRDFRRHPDARIPDKMVGFERCLNIRYPFSDCFHRTDQGELAFVTLTSSAYHLFVGDTKRHLADNEGSFICELITFIDNKPLWLHRSPDVISDCRLILDDQELVCKPCIDNVTVQHDGSIIFTHTEGGGSRFIGVYQNGELTSVRTAKKGICGFFKTKDGKQWIIFSTSSVGRFANAVCSLGPGQTQSIHGNNILDRVEGVDSDELAFVCGGNEVGLYYVMDEKMSRHCPIGQVPYLSSCTHLPNNTWAYIGQAAHQQQCWVIHHKPQPAFEWVSQLFDHPDHGLCYWGIIGNALVTMCIYR